MKNQFLLKETIFLLLIFFAATELSAQTQWHNYSVAFTDNGPYRKDNQPQWPNIEIKVTTGPNATPVTIVLPAGLTSITPETLPANSCKIYKLINSSQVGNGVDGGVFHALPATGTAYAYGNTKTSTRRVTIVSRNYPLKVEVMTQVLASADVTNVMLSRISGTNVTELGTEHICINYKSADYVTSGTGYTPKAGYMIVRPQDDDDPIQIFENGTLKTTMSISESVYYGYQFVGDMTGTVVTTSSPVAFYAFSSMSDVPYGTPTGDVLMQQLPPVNQWGRRFAVPILPELSKNRIRIVASENGTNINIPGISAPGSGGMVQGPLAVIMPTGNNNNKYTLTGLKKGEFVEIELSSVSGTKGGCYITANKPIGVCSFLTCNNMNTNDSDPAQAWIPPIEQSEPSVQVSAFQPDPNTSLGGGTWIKTSQHYAMIITKTSAISQTTGHPDLPNGVTWYEIEHSDYSYCRVTLSSYGGNTPSIYTISNPEKVIVGEIGTGPAEAYYSYPTHGTGDLSNMVLPTIHISPNPGDTVCLGTSVIFSVDTVENQGNNPVYQWKVNGNNVGTNSLSYTYVPLNGDKILCVLTSDDPNVNPKTADSNLITMTVKDNCFGKIKVVGTVFPFVHWAGRDKFNVLFPITVSLKSIPTDISSESAFELLLAENALYTTTTVYYDGTVFVPNSPKSPGALGEFNNFGLPVNFPDAIGKSHGYSNSDILIEEEEPYIEEGITLGLFEIPDVLPGDYLLEIKREGYMVRWAKINVSDQNAIQYLGHREIIPGDIVVSLEIDSQDETTMLQKDGLFLGHPDYLPLYDLNSDGYIDAYDYYLLQKYINFRFYHYEETMNWLSEY